MLDVTRLPPKMLDKCQEILAGGVVWSNILVPGLRPPLLFWRQIIFQIFASFTGDCLVKIKKLLFRS